MTVATKKETKATANPRTKTVKAEKGNRRLVELVARLDDEKGQPFSALVSALSAKGFHVERGSRGGRKDGRVIYSVVANDGKK